MPLFRLVGSPIRVVPKSKHNELCFLVEAILEMRASELDEKSDTLTIDAIERGGKLAISLTDKGLPYMPTDNQLRVFNNAKLGQLQFEQLGVDGQRVTFLVDQAPYYIMPTPPSHIDEVLLDRDVSCRRTTSSSEDILEAIRCLYEVYGYNYLHQNLYHTDEFRRMLQSGRYISVLIENAHHQVLGHAALEEHEWFGGLREVCNLVVKPISRGLGLSGKLVGYLVEDALRDGTGNLYALPVLHHPISQKLLNRADFTPCGLTASLLDMKDNHGHEDAEGRASTAICVRKVADVGSPALYLPAECVSFARDVLAQAHMSWHKGAEGAELSPSTKLSYSNDSVHRYVEVKVDKIGPDANERLMLVQAP